MLTEDGQRTTHDAGRQPIAIGHLSDSGDLKKTVAFSEIQQVRDCFRNSFQHT